MIERFPQLLHEWAHDLNPKIEPECLTHGSTREVWWRCQRGHVWKASPNARISHGYVRRCPYCAGRLILAGFNDLATTHPQLASEWDYVANSPLAPLHVMAGSSKTAHWQCSACEHRWEAPICNRALGGNRCPACTGRVVIPGKNSLDKFPPNSCSVAPHPECPAQTGLSPRGIKPEVLVVMPLRP